jgi:hypothetical protein
MAHEQPVVMIDDGSGNRVDRHNLRTAAWGGLIGTALEQYDFVIYGTATAIVFNKIFFPGADPAVGVIAGFATYGWASWPGRWADCSSPATATGSDASSCSSRRCS